MWAECANNVQCFIAEHPPLPPAANSSGYCKEQKLTVKNVDHWLHSSGNHNNLPDTSYLDMEDNNLYYISYNSFEMVKNFQIHKLLQGVPKNPL